MRGVRWTTKKIVNRSIYINIEKQADRQTGIYIPGAHFGVVSLPKIGWRVKLDALLLLAMRTEWEWEGS